MLVVLKLLISQNFLGWFSPWICIFAFSLTPMNDIWTAPLVWQSPFSNTACIRVCLNDSSDTDKAFLGLTDMSACGDIDSLCFNRHIDLFVVLIQVSEWVVGAVPTPRAIDHTTATQVGWVLASIGTSTTAHKQFTHSLWRLPALQNFGHWQFINAVVNSSI